MIADHQHRIYLASRSPRRRALLKQIGVNFEVLMFRDEPPRGPDVDETPLAGEHAHDYVTRLARLKAEVGWMCLIKRGLPKLPVLASDTTISLDDEIMGKPADREAAEAILQRLSGRAHEVLTAVAMSFEGQTKIKLSATTVEFKLLTEQNIKHYVATGEPFGKAGAYAVQGLAAAFIARIEGSYSGVMGLPLFETAELLGEFGMEIL